MEEIFVVALDARCRRCRRPFKWISGPRFCAQCHEDEPMIEKIEELLEIGQIMLLDYEPAEATLPQDSSETPNGCQTEGPITEADAEAAFRRLFRE
jgi:hypothetical protein